MCVTTSRCAPHRHNSVQRINLTIEKNSHEFNLRVPDRKRLFKSLDWAVKQYNWQGKSLYKILHLKLIKY